MNIKHVVLTRLIIKRKNQRQIKQRIVQFWSIQGSILFLVALSPVTAQAQVIPDKTLPVNSVVTQQDDIKLIDGGTAKSGNLFHSFDQFSVPTDNTVLFNNALNIRNIFSRVTGSTISNINGLIKANGTANLFLINPNGIVLGRNARLDIGGSFFASTASAIKFVDGTEFNAVNPQKTPLLTISVPIGLQYNVNSGKIQVQGDGKGLASQSTLRSPYIKSSRLTGLEVKPGKTIALLGGDVSLEGGTLTAKEGQIKLAGVGSGVVTLIPSGLDWTLNYEGVFSFQDIYLSQRSLLDTSGNSSGSITLVGKLISLIDGSVVLNQNLGTQLSGNIDINATELLRLSGASPDGKFVTFLRTESLSSGNSGNINVSTKKLDIQGGAGMGTRTYNTGNGGDVNVNASESVHLFGFLPSNPFITSGIINSTLNSGDAGSIVISTERLVAQDGGLITSLTTGIGSGASVTINATNSVKLTTSAELINSEIDYIASYFSSGTVSTGNAGNLTVNTPDLVVGEVTSVSTSTRGFGSAGTIDINASNVEVSGSVQSSAVKASTDTQKVFGAPPVPSGSPGEVNINTGTLRIANGGQVSVTNEGTSTDAGKLTIHARSITLDNKSSITAATASGEGGNIDINSQDLQLHNSTISATAEGNGNGGNIDITTQLLTGSENSSIKANAVIGNGGNININAQILFFSPDSFITASSQLGVDGTVNINFGNQDPTRGVMTVPKIVQQPPKIASGCAAQSGTGRALLAVANNSPPPNFDEHLDPQPIWQRNSISVESTESPAKSQSSTIKEATKIVEAQGWVINSQGNVELVATIPNQAPHDSFLATNSCSSVGSVAEIFPSVETK
ncbi:two-partner secretion domain-containing protein [aff. Roholtiella sp. LEGE 12411]|uniref:two-partner secretion domain-containing protein n=1 Tax=aff. Roholtiella sp. LEGE 12411 TaxID=1828822 RepID=UPI00187EE213|nr:filamentous hemagglutinin N-terminal domain-containing protein [aff. Roholtiella sp. LEGE 12411]MBE9037015.1 filamentous hemagglutinin N-terminal domain-containing protein [aff. Roholtiella sp. LEGE 12411]